jgi:DNA invertase Pin-like site-specific DNA recombinase
MMSTSTNAKGKAMRVIGYIRVSTEEQATHGISLASQRAKLEAYASLYDLELVEVIADEGVSAKSLNRPGLQRAMALLSRGQVDGLLIVKLDRLTRSVGDWQTLIDGYFSERAGRQLFSVGDSIDTRTAAGRMVLNILLSVAQWEREAIGERTRDALQHKISRNERCGKVRFGYQLAADGVHLEASETEQQVLAIIAELRAAGESLRAIAAELTRRQIATKQGNAKWTHTAIDRIIRRTHLAVEAA